MSTVDASADPMFDPVPGPPPDPGELTVLYDAGCPLCSRFASWLGAQATLVPLHLILAGSAEAVRRFPGLDHRRTLREVTVVGADGSVWTREHAWVMCLWATRAHRGLAERLARPSLLPLARAAATTAAGLRQVLPRSAPLATGSGPPGGVYADGCAGACDPQG